MRAFILRRVELIRHGLGNVIFAGFALLGEDAGASRVSRRATAIPTRISIWTRDRRRRSCWIASR